jgi:endonuclease YncB( thermonuclease family)
MQAIVQEPVDGDSVDGDSVWLQPVAPSGPPTGPRFKARIGGIDAPSSGADAEAAKALIASWRGRRVWFRETCCGRPHGEVPGIVTDVSTGENLGKLLVARGFARRWAKFPIEAALLPSLSGLAL